MYQKKLLKDSSLEKALEYYRRAASKGCRASSDMILEIEKELEKSTLNETQSNSDPNNDSP